MKPYHKEITFVIAFLLVTTVLRPILNGIEELLDNYTELIAYQVVIPV